MSGLRLHLWRCCRPSWSRCACGGAFPHVWSRLAPCCQTKLLHRPSSCLKVRASEVPAETAGHAISQQLQLQLPQGKGMFKAGCIKFIARLLQKCETHLPLCHAHA